MECAPAASEATVKAAEVVTSATSTQPVPRRAKGAAPATGSAERTKPARRRRSTAGLQAAAMDDIRGDRRTLLARLEAEACDPFSYDEEDELPRRDPYGRSPGGGGTTHRSVVVATRTAADAAEEAQIALALALSLSLCDAGDGPPGRGDHDDVQRASLSDGHVEASPWRADALQAGPPAEVPPHALSYEALVQLEAVRSVATSAEVDTLPAVPFDAAAHGGDDARCPICLDPLAVAQADVEGGGELRVGGLLVLRLPCGHAMHAACGRGYLTQWSKRCAEVHCRQSVRPCDADERRTA